MNEGRDLGYGSFKVKIGLHDEREDAGVVAAVRKEAGDRAFLWVDANQVYTLDAAIRQARRWSSTTLLPSSSRCRPTT